jgi:hypothetical protein
MLAIGNVAAHRAQVLNQSLGIPNHYSIGGRIVTDRDHDDGGRAVEVKGPPECVTSLVLPVDYAAWLTGIKQHVQNVQQRAVLAVNRELVLLYWQIGRDILERQQAQGWGAKVIDQLARDLTAAFPDMKGFSRRKPALHAQFRRRVARADICARGTCTIALVSPGDPAGQAEDALRP